MCIRFSVDGREWWDSNNGLNYNFTFKKAVPRRSRASGPAAFGANGFLRLNEPSATTLPGLRQDRQANPAATQIKKAFGSPDDRKNGPRSWVFPKLAAQIHAPRPDSPISRPPPESFRAPNVPDVHTHLSLSKYCAPSPPTSPPKEDVYSFMPTPLALSPESDKMMIMAGGFATISPPITPQKPPHERRSSWNGHDSLNSISQTMNGDDTPHATDGETTPVAIGSRSPRVTESSTESSPESRPLTLKPSTGNLRALLADDAGSVTPPSSNLSSPHSPSIGLPLPMSPSVASSTTSTGESSPVNTVSSDSTPDLANLAINIDPQERGRPTPPKMLGNSYQEFVSCNIMTIMT